MADEFKIGDILPPNSLIELDQFYLRDKNVYCFRPSCGGCSWEGSCEKEQVSIKIGPGMNIRQAMCAPAGWGLAAIDFKQIEIRVAAQLSGEPLWIDAFLKDLDLHTQMARVGWKIPEPTPVPKHIRDAAKAANFGNLFLGSPQTLAAQSSLSLVEAVAAHRIWWDSLPVYKAWTEAQIRFYRGNGYVTTYFGRRREMGDIVAKALAEEEKKKRNPWGFGDRTSVNSPIQGCLQPNTYVLTSKGYIQIKKLYELQEQGKLDHEVWTGFRFAKFSVLNRGVAQFVNISLENRPDLPCDNRHKVRVKDLITGEFVWTNFEDLRTGAIIAIAKPVWIGGGDGKATSWKKALEASPAERIRFLEQNYQITHNGFMVSQSKAEVKGVYLILRTLGIDSKIEKTSNGWQVTVTQEPVLLREGNTIHSQVPTPGTYIEAKVTCITHLDVASETYTLSVEDDLHQFDSEGVISKNTAADLMKLGMVLAQKWIKKESLEDQLRITLTVHDELVVLFRKGDHQYELLREIGRILTHTPKGHKLPNLPKWKVPLGVDIEIGDNWAELTDIDKLDPATKDKPKKAETSYDTILIVPTLSTEQVATFKRILTVASSVENVVMVPFKLQMGGKVYKHPTITKVHLPTLEAGIKAIPGLSLKEQ